MVSEIYTLPWESFQGQSLQTVIKSQLLKMPPRQIISKISQRSSGPAVPGSLCCSPLGSAPQKQAIPPYLGPLNTCLSSKTSWTWSSQSLCFKSPPDIANLSCCQPTLWQSPPSNPSRLYSLLFFSGYCAFVFHSIVFLLLIFLLFICICPFPLRRQAGFFDSCGYSWWDCGINRCSIFTWWVGY